jgi:hypothetical protein
MNVCAMTFSLSHNLAFPSMDSHIVLSFLLYAQVYHARLRHNVTQTLKLSYPTDVFQNLPQSNENVWSIETKLYAGNLI